MAQKPSFDSNSFKSSSLKNSVSQRSLKNSASQRSFKNSASQRSLTNSASRRSLTNSASQRSFKNSASQSSLKNLASQRSFCNSKCSGPKIRTTRQSPISLSPTRTRNNPSFSLPSVIKSDDSKPACAPPQTSKVSQVPFSVFYSSLSIKIRRCFILPPYFKFLNYRSNVMQQHHCILP